MSIGGIISSVLHDLAQALRTGSAQKPEAPTAAQEAFTQILAEKQKEAEKGSLFKRGAVVKDPAAKLSLGQKPLPFLGTYNAKGQLSLTKLKHAELAQQAAQLAQSGSSASEEAQANAARQLAKPGDELMATLLQQAFQFLHDQFKREQPKRTLKRRKPQLDVQAEEEAYELLIILLEQAPLDFNEMPAFCLRISQVLDHIEHDLEERMGSLPDVASKKFQIIRDAIMALEHGVTPEQIFDRLEEVLSKGEA